MVLRRLCACWDLPFGLQKTHHIHDYERIAGPRGVTNITSCWSLRLRDNKSEALCAAFQAYCRAILCVQSRRSLYKISLTAKDHQMATRHHGSHCAGQSFHASPEAGRPTLVWVRSCFRLGETRSLGPGVGTLGFACCQASKLSQMCSCTPLG